MPGPTTGSLHVDGLLTNMSIGYKNLAYIADQLFPIVPVLKQSDIVPKYDQSHWFRDAARIRIAGTAAQSGTWTVDKTDTYYCLRYSYAAEVNDEQRDNADLPWQLDQEAVDYVMDKIMMRREVSFVTDFMKTSVWGTDLSATSGDFVEWGDYADSTPLVDLQSWVDTIEGKIGQEPNSFTIGKQVWSKLKWHPDILDLIKYTQRGQISPELFQALAEIPKFHIGKAIYTASPEGTAEASVTYSRIWGKNGLLMYVPDAPSLRTPAAGYTFTWRRVPNSLQYFRRIRNDEREVDKMEGNTYFDQKVTASRAGLYVAGLVS